MVIPNSQGQTLLPVMVAVAEQGRRIVGPLARRQAVIFAEHTATGLKRLIGRKYSSHAVRQVMDMVSYRISGGAGDEPQATLRGESVHRRPLHHRRQRAKAHRRAVPESDSQQGRRHRPGSLYRRPASVGARPCSAPGWKSCGSCRSR